MEKNTNEEILFVCSCNNTEHQLIMCYDNYKDMPEFAEVFVSVHLIPERNIFKRIKNAFKYIFGHKSIYGDFDEFIFKPTDWRKLDKVVKYLKEIDKRTK